MKIRFIGDTHEIERWAELRAGAKVSVHVGDVAFAEGRGTPPKPQAGHGFIRGNKDDVFRCLKRSDFLGEYGHVKSLNIYVISGAASVEGGSEYDELTSGAFENIYYDIIKRKPEVIVSHDCPFSLGLAAWQGETKTNKWLDKIFNRHQPRLWVFGHHHVDFDKTVEGTRFVGIGKYQTVELDI